MFFNKIDGNIGENIACNYLIKNKYKIVEQNFRNKLGEIDIIAIDKDVLVFVEVKMRKNTAYGLPQEAIDSHKQHKITLVATSYLKRKSLLDKVKIRFDCIAIIGDKNDYSLNHIKNIF